MFEKSGLVDGYGTPKYSVLVKVAGGDERCVGPSKLNVISSFHTF